MNNQQKYSYGNYNYPKQNEYINHQQPYQQQPQYTHELQNIQSYQQKNIQNQQNPYQYPQNYQNPQLQQQFINSSNNQQQYNSKDINKSNNNVYDTQYLNQLSESSLDMEIKNNEVKIQLLKSENKDLNDEIQNLNKQQQYQQIQYQPQPYIQPNNGQLIANNNQLQPNNSHAVQNYNQNTQNNGIMMLNNSYMMYKDFTNLNTDCPEVIYCTANIHSINKYQNDGIGTQGLINLLQHIHNSIQLDYSKINILGNSNLFKDDFVEKEIIEPLAYENNYQTLKTIEESKPVYCCKTLHKQLNKYGLSIQIFSSVWTFILALAYIITSFSRQKQLNSLIMMAYILQIVYLTVEAILIYFGMSKCSIKSFQALSVMSQIGIFFNFIMTAASMFNMVGFHIEQESILLVALNVLNMFLQVFFCAAIQGLALRIKKLCAVVKQITSVELVE